MNIKQTPLWKSANYEKENYDVKYNRKVLDLRKTAEDDNQNTQQQVDNSQNQTQQVNNDVPNNNNPYAADSKTQNPYVTAKNENEKSAKESIYLTKPYVDIIIKIISLQEAMPKQSIREPPRLQRNFGKKLTK